MSSVSGFTLSAMSGQSSDKVTGEFHYYSYSKLHKANYVLLNVILLVAIGYKISTVW